MTEITRSMREFRREHPVFQYILDNSVRLHPVQEKLREKTLALPRSMMMSSADEMQFLGNMLKLIKAKKTLDIGVFTGYSALSQALVLPPDGRVVACDVSDEYVNMGKPFWKEAGVENKIDLRIAPAADTLQSLLDAGEAGTFDFSFIDADKPNYDRYYEMSLKLVRSGGIIAIDNVLWGGSVADPEIKEESTQCIRDLNAKVAKDERVDVSMLFLADGVTLAFKR